MDIPERNDMEDMSMVDMEEFAASSSSPADSMLDSVIGCIEDIIMEKEFQQGLESFMEKHCMEFDDSEENKLSYTTIFNEYVNLMESLLEQQLVERIPGFHMNTFIDQVMKCKDEVPEDIFEMLLTFTDFMAFKKDILDYRAEKEGRNLDLSRCLVVTSMTSSGTSQADCAEL